MVEVDEDDEDVAILKLCSLFSVCLCFQLRAGSCRDFSKSCAKCWHFQR